MNCQEIETRHRQIEAAVNEAIGRRDLCPHGKFDEMALRIRSLRLEQKNLERIAADKSIVSDQDAACIAEIAMRLCNRSDADEEEKQTMLALIAGVRNRLLRKIAA